MANIEVEKVALQLAQIASSQNVRFAFAESCTGGMASALITTIPGISGMFCGSAVTYRKAAKQSWLGVDAGTLQAASAESPETTQEMAAGVLDSVAEADFAAAITGHLGPGAADEVDGVVFVCLVKRNTCSQVSQDQAVFPNYKHQNMQFTLEASERSDRQLEAARLLLGSLCEFISTTNPEAY